MTQPSTSSTEHNALPASNLTWQQQLMASSWAQERPGESSRNTPRRKKKDRTSSASSAPKKGAEKQAAAPAPTSGSALTWQQELFQQSQRAGPKFDHAADARDVATFGAPAAPGPSAQSGGTARKSRSRGKKSSKDNKGSNPSTPVREPPPLLPSEAYAGPTFHNSPPATSLPAPRFSRATKSPLPAPLRADGAAAAPAAPADAASVPTPRATSPSQAAFPTVDTLLAQMLQPASISPGPP